MIEIGMAASSAAQTRPLPPRLRPVRPTPHAGSFELGGGLMWQGGFDLGSSDAELTRNPATGTGPFDLFTSDSSLGSGIGLQAKLAVYATRSLAIEAGGRITRPELRVRLSGDAESAASQTARETLTQYVIDGSALWHFAPLRRGRVVPFVGGGGGYIRDLHEGSELMETGTEYHAIAGAKFWFSSRPRRLGLRGEAGVSVRDGGFDFRDGRRTVPIASVSLTYMF